MSMQRWIERFQQWFGANPALRGSGEGAPNHTFGGAGMLRGLSGRNPEIADLQEEVADEQRGRVALVSRSAALNCWLLAVLREHAQLCTDATIVEEGFFTLVTLPDLAVPPAAGADAPTDDGWQPQGNWLQQEIYDALAGMDLILYLWDADKAWQPDDDRWYSRLRSLAIPILPVLVANGDSSAGAGSDEHLRHHLGVKPAYVQRPPASGPPVASESVLNELVDRMLAVRPRLSIPLAQEVPACRQLIARRVVRTGSLMAMLVGAEPFPLLDLPLTVLVQWKMALQLAAIHGRPGLDVLSQEMAGTIGLNLIVRLIAQQAFKLVPVVGWVISAGLNFASTWLLGKALMNYYGAEREANLRAALHRPGAVLRTTLRSARWRRPLALPRLRRKQPPPEQDNGHTDEQGADSPAAANNGRVPPEELSQLSGEAGHD